MHQREACIVEQTGELRRDFIALHHHVNEDGIQLGGFRGKEKREENEENGEHQEGNDENGHNGPPVPYKFDQFFFCNGSNSHAAATHPHHLPVLLV